MNTNGWKNTQPSIQSRIRTDCFMRGGLRFQREVTQSANAFHYRQEQVPKLPFPSLPRANVLTC